MTSIHTFTSVRTNLQEKKNRPVYTVQKNKGKRVAVTNQKHSPTRRHESKNANNYVPNCHVRECNQRNQNGDKSQEYQSLD